MNITPKQKKAFYDLLTEKNIDWSEFKEEIVPKNENHKEYSRLVHIKTGLYFGYYVNELFDSLYPQTGGWYVERSPGIENRTTSSHPTLTWEKLINCFDDWSKDLQNELHANRFLEQLEEYKIEVQQEFSLESESPFTDEQEDFIKEQLTIFRLELTDLAVSDVQQINIEKRIQYLESRLEKKYPKIDWLNIFVGQITSMIADKGLELAKDPSVIAKLALIFHAITGGRFIN